MSEDYKIPSLEEFHTVADEDFTVFMDIMLGECREDNHTPTLFLIPIEIFTFEELKEFILETLGGVPRYKGIPIACIVGTNLLILQTSDSMEMQLTITRKRVK